MLDASPISVFLATAKPEESKTFYQKVMGLTLTDDNPFAVVFKLKGAELRISKVQSFTPQPWTVLDWQVEDLEKTMSELTNKDVSFERFEGMDQDENGVWATPDGVRIAWFKDPDGNVLSVSKRK